MRGLPRFAIVSSLVLLVVSCVRSNTELVGPKRYPPTLPDGVTVYVSVDDVAAQNLDYERVAMVFIRADQRYTNEPTIMTRARVEAAKVGANGVILGDTREPGFWSNDRQAGVLAIVTRPKVVSH